MSIPSRQPRTPTLSPPLGTTRRLRPHQSLSNKLDLDSAFFWLLLAFLITTFTFLSLREHHSLDASQLAEYERRTQYLSNSTVYIVEATRSESLLSKLSAEEWKNIGRDVDLVAIVFDDLPLFLTDDWIAITEKTMNYDRMQIVLFRCGCILPSRYFSLTDMRMDGYECVLLPGFVLDERDVKWMQVNEGKECRGRDAILNARGTSMRWRKELAEIKRLLAANSVADGDTITNVKLHVPRLGQDEIQHSRSSGSITE